MSTAWIVAHHCQLQETIQQVLRTALGAGAERDALIETGRPGEHLQLSQESSTGLPALQAATACICCAHYTSS